MGLDKVSCECFNDGMIKQLLQQLGVLRVNSQDGFRGLWGAKKVRESPLTAERVRFEKDVREQFVKLKEKGISIPVFTL